jgi:hypothetical protein
VNVEIDDDPMQRDRDHHRLEDEGDARGYVEMRCVLRMGLPGRRRGQQQSLQGIDLDHAEQPSLIKQREAQDQNAGIESVRSVVGKIGEPRHQSPCDT